MSWLPWLHLGSSAATYSYRAMFQNDTFDFSTYPWVIFPPYLLTDRLQCCDQPFSECRYCISCIRPLESVSES